MLQSAKDIVLTYTCGVHRQKQIYTQK